MKRTRWGKKYVDRRNWKKYNKKLVKRGEAYLFRFHRFMEKRT